MAKAAAAEPSMEEILASIRRIISDESAPKAPAADDPVVPPKPPAPALAAEHVSEEDLDRLFAESGAVAPEEREEGDGDVAAEPAGEEVLDLATVATVEDDEDGGFAPEEVDLEFIDPEPAPVLAPAPVPLPDVGMEAAAAEEVAPARPAADAPRQRRAAASANREEDELLISEAAGASVHAAFGALSHTILTANAKTLDDLVKDMLRPMLRAWLDENLPAVVERLVRAEIERVSRGR